MKTDNVELPAETPVLVDESLAEVASETRQFVTFFAGNEVFAVDMAPV